MKTNSHIGSLTRFGALLGMLGVMATASVSAQTVEFVIVEKFSDYQQTDVSTTVPHSSPYGFGVFVEGSDIAPPSFPDPTFTSAPGSGTSGTIVLDYDDGDGEQWAYEVPFASQGALNTAFADGTYTVNVNGATVELALSGSAFPNTPLATFNQGFWSGGVYYFDPTQDLVITSNVFTNYGANVDGVTNLYLSSQTGPGYYVDVENFFSEAPGANPVEFTIDAFDIVSGQTLELELAFISIMSVDTDALLPDALIAAVYSTFTFVQLQAIPEPSTSAILVGGAGLAAAVGLRRRRR